MQCDHAPRLSSVGESVRALTTTSKILGIMADIPAKVLAGLYPTCQISSIHCEEQ